MPAGPIPSPPLSVALTLRAPHWLLDSCQKNCDGIQWQWISSFNIYIGYKYYNLSLVSTGGGPWPGSGSLLTLIHLILIFGAWTSGAPSPAAGPQSQHLSTPQEMLWRDFDASITMVRKHVCTLYSHQIKIHDKMSFMTKFSYWCSPQTSSPCLQLSCPASPSSSD